MNVVVTDLLLQLSNIVPSEWGEWSEWSLVAAVWMRTKARILLAW